MSEVKVLSATDKSTKALLAAVAAAESAAKAELAETIADHKVAVAEKDADIRALTQEVSFQAKTITSLQDTITAEREARVDEAKARGVSAVTVQTTGK